MKSPLIVFVIGALLSLPALAETPDYSEQVTVWQTDYSGRPPFARQQVSVPVADTASLAMTETEVVWTTRYAGRPPFKRGMLEVPVVDAASLETTSREKRQLRFTAKPRHR